MLRLHIFSIFVIMMFEIHLSGRKSQTVASLLFADDKSGYEHESRAGVLDTVESGTVLHVEQDIKIKYSGSGTSAHQTLLPYIESFQKPESETFASTEFVKLPTDESPLDMEDYGSGYETGSGVERSTISYQTSLTTAFYHTPDSNQKLFHLCEVREVHLNMFLESTFIVRAESSLSCSVLLTSKEVSLEIETIPKDAGQPKYIFMEDINSNHSVDVSDATRFTISCKPMNIRLYVSTQSKLDLIFRRKPPSHNSTHITQTSEFCSLSTNFTVYDDLKFSNTTKTQAGYKKSSFQDLKCPGTCNCCLGKRHYQKCPHTEQYQNVLLQVSFETQILDLSHERIKTLRPAAFQDLISMTRLLLEDVQLSEIEPGAFIGLEKLDRLYLRRNLLKTLLPGAFRGLGNLKRLYLSDNLLHTLPSNVFQDVRNLHYLVAVDNFITEISNGAFPICHPSLSWT